MFFGIAGRKNISADERKFSAEIYKSYRNRLNKKFFCGILRKDEAKAASLSLEKPRTI